MLNWLTQSKFYGLNTLRKSDEIQRGEAALALNSDHSTSSSLGPLQGYTLFGNQNNVADYITRKFTYERGNGFQTQLQVRDNAVTSILEYLHPGDIRNSADGEWLILISGLTTAVKTDGSVDRTKVMGFCPFNDSGTDNLLFCNGTDNFSRASVALAVISVALAGGEATVTVSKVTGDPKTNATDGFAASGSFIYRNTAGTTTTVTYSGKTASTFTGCSGVTATAINTGIIEAADTATYSALPKNNILDAAQGRVVGAGRSDAPNQWSVSRVSDFTDWTSSSTPDDAQSIDFPEGGISTALSHLDEWFFYLKERVTWAISFQITQVSDGSGGSVAALQSIKKRVAGVGAACQKAIINANDDVLFTSSDGQMRRLFRLSGEKGFQTEDLNEQIRPTIVNFVWTDCAMLYISKQRTVVSSGRSASTVPINDKAIVYQYSKNDDGTARLNHGTIDWFIGDMCMYNEKPYFGSSIESRTFEMFKGFSKNGAPYDWVRTERAETFPELGGHFNTKFVTHIGVRGLIATGTTLIITVDYDINGSSGSTQMQITGTDSNYIVTGNLNMLNSFALNTEPLNGTREGLSDMNPFFVIYALANEYLPYDTQLTFQTSGTGQNVEIDAYGYLVEDPHQQVNSVKLKEIGLT